jgi:hypothetical protein
VSAKQSPLRKLSIELPRVNHFYTTGTMDQQICAEKG